MQSLLLETKETEEIAAWFKQTSLSPTDLSKESYRGIEGFWDQKRSGDALSVAFHLTFKPEYNVLVEVVFSTGLGPIVLPGPDDPPSLSWKRPSIKSVRIDATGNITDEEGVKKTLLSLLKVLLEIEHKALEGEKSELQEAIGNLEQQINKIDQRLATITK